MNYNNIMKIIRKYFHSIWKLKAFYTNIRHWNNLHILQEVTMQYIHIHPLEVHSRNKYIYLKPARGNRSVGYDASCLTTASHNFHLAVIAIISAHFRNELLENVLWLSLETFLANFFNNSQVKCWARLSVSESLRWQRWHYYCLPHGSGLRLREREETDWLTVLTVTGGSLSSSRQDSPDRRTGSLNTTAGAGRQGQNSFRN